MQFKSIKTKLLVSLFVAGLSISSCFAANVLSQIEISPSDTGSYKISFGAQKPDEVKKIISSDNKMVLELKGVSISDAYNTIYDNVADIDSVVVDAVTKNSAKITFEGKNVANSQIFFETTQEDAVATNGNKAETGTDAIELARPVNEYAPVYSKEYVENMDTQESYLSNLKLTVLSILKNRRVRHYVKSGMRKVANNASKENLAYVLLGISFLALLIKVLRPAKKQEKSSTIGLAQTLRQREIARNQDMDIADKIQETQRKTQDPSFNSNSGYAMKSYQASQKNPYTSSLRRSPQRPTYMNSNTKTQSMPKMNNSQLRAQANNMQMANPTASAPINPNKKINVDSTKFLESMAKIYEKNGRIDLARGLQANIKKATAQKQAV